jgi:hypothetical protein
MSFAFIFVSKSLAFLANEGGILIIIYILFLLINPIPFLLHPPRERIFVHFLGRLFPALALLACPFRDEAILQVTMPQNAYKFTSLADGKFQLRGF